MLEKQPHTLTEAIRRYSDPQTCIDAVAALRWPDGKPVCPRCDAAEGERKHYWLKTQRRWKCYACRKQFSVKVGTIFEDSPLGLDIWLTALWMLCNCKNGVSSYEIARATGIAQKSAWFVLQRLRLVLKDVKQVKLENGPVEIDECYLGGHPKNMHKERRKRLHGKFGIGGDHKVAVMGMLDRETRQVRARLIPQATREVLQDEIFRQIERGATIYTDGHLGYDRLSVNQFVHETVTHIEEYVRGNVHTQGIENFWSLLKRTLKGTYVAVEPFHLSRYVDEQVFRFNNRINHNDGTRFAKALAQVAGRRLTWNDLTGKEDPKDADVPF
jgi:transposase-like protein